MAKLCTLLIVVIYITGYIKLLKLVGITYNYHVCYVVTTTGFGPVPHARGFHVTRYGPD